jgi:hypothetical protein
MLFVYLFSLVLTSYISNDIINVATGVSVYIFILVKWIIIFSLLLLISLTLMKILNTAKNPFEKKSNDVEDDSRKNRILNKEQLTTKRDLILEKYRDTKGAK